MSDISKVIITCSKDRKHAWIRNAQFNQLKIEDHIAMTMDSLVPCYDSVGYEIIVKGKDRYCEVLNRRFKLNEIQAVETYYKALDTVVDLNNTKICLYKVDYSKKKRELMKFAGAINKKSQSE